MAAGPLQPIVQQRSLYLRTPSTRNNTIMKIFFGLLASLGFLWILYGLITGQLIKRPFSTNQKYIFYILLLLILAQAIVKNFDLNIPGF